MLEYVLTDEGADLIRKDLCQRLREGQVGIVPTDTVYGLVCLADHAGGCQRLAQLKPRPAASQKSQQFLLGSLDHCACLDVPVSPVLARLAATFWPGPLAVVVADRRQHLVGLRIPDHAFLRRLLVTLGRPLLATSADLSGEDPSQSYEQIFREFNGEPDFVLLQGALAGATSTAIHLLADGTFTILRAGAITEAQLQAALGR